MMWVKTPVEANFLMYGKLVIFPTVGFTVTKFFNCRFCQNLLFGKKLDLY